MDLLQHGFDNDTVAHHVKPIKTEVIQALNAIIENGEMPVQSRLFNISMLFQVK